MSPVALSHWTGQRGGRGLSILAPFQSRAQLIARSGETGAAIIPNTTAAILVFGGTRDRDDLNYWATLAGERDEPVTTTDPRGRVTSRTVRKVAVLAPAQLANLPAGRVVVFRRGMPVAIGRVRMAWRRRDVRHQTRLARRVSRAVVVAAEHATRSVPAQADTAAQGVPDAGR